MVILTRKFQLFFLLFLLILLVGFLTFIPSGRLIVKTTLIVSEVIPNFPIKIQRFVTSSPIIEERVVETSIGKVKADLYRPNDGKKHPATVLTLGIVVTRKDSQLVKFAQALSREGFVVLAADLPDLTSGVVLNASIEGSVELFEYLSAQDFVDTKRVGFTAFCAGGSIAIVASEDPRIRDQVLYINTLSPYFSLKELFRAAFTGQIIEKNGQTKKWQAEPQTKEAMVNGSLSYYQDEGERAILKAVALREKQPTNEEIASLSDEAMEAYNFYANNEPQRFDQLWEKLPQGAKELAASISPETKIKDLKAKVFILSDLEDRFIPHTEGKKLAKALPENQVIYQEIDSLEHVRPSVRLPRLAASKQVINLYIYLYKILKQIS